MESQVNKALPTQEEPKEKISRKEALKKTGYIAFSAATMMLLFNNPAKAQAGTSPAPPPGSF
ncbi:MAG: hypothetical protein Q8928_11240 [Bacteroidota bacterium]|nr:hypothetical protein [Bacteroidota bacterium]